MSTVDSVIQIFNEVDTYTKIHGKFMKCPFFTSRGSYMPPLVIRYVPSYRHGVNHCGCGTKFTAWSILKDRHGKLTLRNTEYTLSHVSLSCLLLMSMAIKET